jgi:diguanylate cyclase (GGDEF)-like protein
MIRAFVSTQPWRLVLLTCAITPLTVVCGVRWEETGGAVTLGALTLPVALIALSGSHGWAFTGAAIASLGIVLEALLSGGPDGGDGLKFASVCALGLVLMSGAIALAIRDLQERNGSGSTSAAGDSPLAASREAGSAIAPLPTDVSPDAPLQAAPVPVTSSPDEKVNFPRLLLTLHDIGRRISMNMDLDTLIPAVIGTTKASLDCEECQVYLWEASHKALVTPLPPRPRDRMVFVPDPDRGIAQWVIRERTILMRSRFETDDALRAVREQGESAPAAVAPLVVGGDLLGLLVVDQVQHPEENFEELLYTLANIYAMGIKNAQLFRRVEEMAQRDGLTGLYNHTAFFQQLRDLVRRALIPRTPLSLVMSDVDRFKTINDDYGHQAGDEVLRELARLWRAVMPDTAVLGRYGGEEFIAAIPGCDEARACELAELLRETMAQHPFLHEGRQLTVTASFGVAAHAGNGQSTDEFVRMVDKLLYEAKRTGRNRVCRQQVRPILPLHSARQGG